MAAAKKKILIVDNNVNETHLFGNKTDAENYINEGLDMGDELDNYEVYEVTKQLDLDEVTQVSICDC